MSKEGTTARVDKRHTNYAREEPDEIAMFRDSDGAWKAFDSDKHLRDTVDADEYDVAIFKLDFYLSRESSHE